MIRRLFNKFRRKCLPPFELIPTGPEWSDSTTPFKVIIPEGILLSDFMEAVLDYPYWKRGYITIAKGCEYHVEYENNVMSGKLPFELLASVVKSASAQGGYGYRSFTICI